MKHGGEGGPLMIAKKRGVLHADRSVVVPLTPNPSPALGRGEPKVVGREY